MIIINTCSVRESAENRVGGLINKLTGSIPVKGISRPKIVLSGCMLRYGEKKLKEKFPSIDEFLQIEEIGFQVEPLRINKKEALVPIMEGCNNFCTYCVVPYARGREKSRPFEEILCEVERLIKHGYQEIILLGQNVNSYGKDLKDKKTFALLLQTLDKITGLKKIKFLTSNPWDLTDEIIQSIKLPKVDKYLHLPVQSGDDEILKRMNRHYTVEQYLALIKKIRKEIPEIKIGTDIIVGFPGELEEAFRQTVKLCKKVGFVKAYIARYSPRPGTTAYQWPDSVSAPEKKRRWQVLEKLVNHENF